ncbi:serine protease [Bradyrhizobium guangxiense]
MRDRMLALAILSLAVAIASANAQSPSRRTMESGESRGSPDYKSAVAAFTRGENDKIVGGTPAPQGAYPWQVSLSVSWIADPGRGHFCGGSIYNASWIITAAHCVIDNEPEDIHVVAGTNKLSLSSERLNIKRIIIHRAYSRPKKHDNDVALLELWTPLAFGEKIKAIELLTLADEARVVEVGQPLTVTGWGATQEGNRPIRDLRFVDIPAVSRDTCNQPPSYNHRVTENMICAGRPIGGKDSCQGDSGGPLVSTVLGSARLAGIVSWGDGCARFGKYGVYARVSKYVDWISKCTGRPESC